MFYQQSIPSYGMTKKSYVKVSLSRIDIPAKVKKSPLKKKKVVQKKVQKVQKRSVVDPSDIDIDDLFGSVKTSKVVTKKKKRIDRKRLAQIAKSIQIPQQNSISSSSIKKDTTTKEAKSASSAQQVNQYLAKIHAIVYDHFFPPQNTQGYKAKVLLIVSALGKMIDFKVLEYSGNEALDSEVKEIKSRLKTVLFPTSPTGTTQRITIILKPEDKE